MLTQNEINNLPPPPQKWIDEINHQKIIDSIKILEEYCDTEYIQANMNIREKIKDLMKLDVKQLKKEIKINKKSCGQYDSWEHYEYLYEIKIKQSRNGKVTKKGLVKNLITIYYELLVINRDDRLKTDYFKKAIEYLVDNTN